MGVDEKEHRSGIGRGHHGAGEQGLGPIQPEGELGEWGCQHRAHQDADCGQRQRGGEHAAKCGKARAQAAVEQDQRQRDRTDQIGGTHVVEFDAEPDIAGAHANQQEDQQEGRPEPQRDEARQDAGQHQRGAQQNREADCIECAHGAVESAVCTG